MAQKAMMNNLIFRPHFKTHQCAAIGNWFKESGVNSITVSSVKMATYFASNGWKNITIAFPVNLLEIDELNLLAKDIKLQLIVSDLVTLRKLQQYLLNDAGVFIEIDTGAHRSGVDPSDLALLDEMIDSVQTQGPVEFCGFLSHAGHSYLVNEIEQICDIHRQERRMVAGLGARYRNVFPGLILSTGDTPTCSICNDFIGVDEIRPGNFVFYDVMQAAIGSCALDNVAVALACPVVAVYPSRNEAVLYGGAIHLSKDFIPIPDGRPMFGYLARLCGNGWEILPDDNFVKSLSQEHGLVKLSEKEISNVRPGDILLVLPVHACLTAHQMRHYYTLNGQVLQMMEI